MEVLSHLLNILVENGEDGKMRNLNKIEAKYNVVTEYTNLNLHQAAFSNDVGSAAFALRNGQPVNSVYKGTLPIHAAALAASKDVLKMLIDAGADVNAARLAKNIGAPKESHLHHSHTDLSPGTTGSTALHYAAGSGHLAIVITLLEHGADSNRLDKNGQLPATLALHCGFRDVVHLLVNHTMKTSQTPDEAIDALEDKIVREEQSKHRRPSLPSIIEQSSSTIRNSTSSIRRSNRNRRYSHSESLANVLEGGSSSGSLGSPRTPQTPQTNAQAPHTPIKESFNLNRAGETFSSENVNEVISLNHDNGQQQQQQQSQSQPQPPPQHSLRRLVSKQSLASLFSRSKTDAGKGQETLSDGGDGDEYATRARSNSNSSLSPNTSVPSSPLKKGERVREVSGNNNGRSVSVSGGGSAGSTSHAIQDNDVAHSHSQPPQLPLPQPPHHRHRTNTVSTISSTNTRSTNAQLSATDDNSSHTSASQANQANYADVVLKIPMNQSQHAREAHADRREKRRAAMRQQSATSFNGVGNGSGSASINQSTHSSQSHSPHLSDPLHSTHPHSSHPSHPSHPSHTHRFANLQELPLAEQEERVSSAQAAEMVKRVQKELLTLAEKGKAPNAVDNRRQGSGGSEGVEENDLMERLQRYGETLALEREARKREEEMNGEGKKKSREGSARSVGTAGNTGNAGDTSNPANIENTANTANTANTENPPKPHHPTRFTQSTNAFDSHIASQPPKESEKRNTRHQTSIEKNKLRQSHNTAKKNHYSVRTDVFQNDFDSKVPSPLHVSHTSAKNTPRYSKLLKGIKYRLTHGYGG
ncbi:hypothetical protein E3P98_01078 [Wallemia ichthyophaga]|nr:hypothetical protein E3P98_01078 [Wallemia ichthyophaga]